MVFTTHVEMMIRSDCSVEILGAKKPSFWTLSKKENLSLHYGGVGKEIKWTIFISLLRLKSSRHRT